MVRCKKIVRNSAAAVLTLSLLTGIASAAFGTGTVTASSLRVREDASTSAATLDTLSKGSKVSVLADEQDGFYKVQIGEQVGYMSAEYLDVTEGETLEEAPAADSSAAAEAVEPLYGLVNTSVLNVRSGAGTDYDRVGKLSGGTVVTVLSEAGDGWYQVSTDSLTGYVSGEYLTVVDAKTLEELSTKGLQLVELAMEYLGVPYRYGGASPSGFDCSGFVYYLCKSLGVSVPRTATSQWNGGYDKVSKSELQPGDLVFFSNYSGGSSIGHVGIYIGNNEFIHSSSPTSGGVIISGMAESYYDARYVGACRIF